MANKPRDPLPATDPERPKNPKEPESPESPHGSPVSNAFVNLFGPTFTNSIRPIYTYAPLDSADVVQSIAVLSNEYRTFEHELAELRKQVADRSADLHKERQSGKEQSEQNKKLREALDDLTAKEQLGFLLSRVNTTAQDRLLKSKTFRDRFLTGRECRAFVVSIDIRRSTELMLKARTPELFATFITDLCVEFSQIIAEGFGVFDKFTGDGVLAFFPDFCSSPNSAQRVVSVADQCHAAFSRHYKARRASFSAVLTDIGLGIGIDYGTVRLVQVANGLTVVGPPVVYACRLSGAPAGQTAVNQPAYETISDQCGAHCFIRETEMEVKHEGTLLAYLVTLNSRSISAVPLPDWVNEKDTDEKAKK